MYLLGKEKKSTNQWMKLGTFLLINLLSIFLLSAKAQALPDATQTFSGYTITDGIGTSQDGYFKLACSEGNVKADAYGAYIYEASGNRITSYLEVKVSGTTLGSFRLQSMKVGEYDKNGNGNYFTNVYVVGYANDTVVAQTLPYDSPDQGKNYEENYAIDYSPFAGKAIDKFRVYYTAESYTHQTAFNLVNFTINNASEAPANDSDSAVTAGTGVTEPVILPTTVTSSNAAVDVFDFRITDSGASDTQATGVTQIKLHTSGTGKFDKVTWRLNGPDAVNVTGAYDSAANTITFSGLSISVAEGYSEAYTINAYYNDSEGLTEGATYRLSVNGSSDFTVAASGSQMNSGQADVNNGEGSAVGVTATKLMFKTQPSGATSGISLTTQPVVVAADASGNVDRDYTGAISLSEASAGSLSGTTSLNAVAGYAIFSGIGYTAMVDQETFALNAQSGTLASVVSDTVTSDVVATRLVFKTQPLPVSILSDKNISFTTVPVLEAVDENGVTDTGYHTDIVLTITDPKDGTVDGTVNTLSATGDKDASMSAVTLTPTGGKVAFTGLLLNYTVGGNSDTIAMRASSGALTAAGSDAITAVSAPEIISVTLPGDGSYAAGTNMDFTLQFSEAISVTDNGGANQPYITIHLNTGGAVRAYYVSGTGTDTLVFRYTVTAGNQDKDGITLDSAVSLNDSATIRNSANIDAELTFKLPATTGILVDTTAPAAPSILSIAEDTGISSSDGLTKDQTLDINGTAEAGSTVTIYLDSASLGTTTAAANGIWYFNNKSTALEEGTHALTAKATDSAGNTSSESSAYSLIIDVTAPANGGIAINNGDLYTKSRAITLTMSADGASRMMISENSDFSGVSYEAYAANKKLTLSTGDGTKTVYVKYSDDAGNEVSSSLSDTITLDTQAPAVSVTSSLTGRTNAETIPITISFSESITNFDINDIIVGNGTSSNFAGSGTTYTADITPAADGTITVDINENAACDAAGNGNTAAVQFSIITDRNLPTVTITSPEVFSTSSDIIPVNITFSENVTGFDVSDITVGNGTAGTFTAINGKSYTAVIIPAADGIVTIDITADAVQDATGNGNTAAAQFNIISDRTAPVLSGVSISNITNTGISISAGINEAGKIYYIIVPDASTAPAPSEVKAGAAYSGTVILSKGSQMVSTSPCTVTFPVNNLFPGTAYDIYVVAEDDENSPNTVTHAIKLDVTTTQTYTVTYDINSGTGTIPADNTNYLEGATVVLADKTGFNKTHYTFSGWSLTQGGSAIEGNMFTMGTSNQILYAVWTENPKYSVTYNPNGGGGTVPVDSTLYYSGDVVRVATGSAISVTGSALTLANHSFGGWSTAVNGGAVGSTYTMGDSDITFYAVWIEDGKYTVIYDANGGTGQVPTDSHQYYQGTTVNLLSGESLSKTHYSFTGWADSPSASAVTGSAIVISNSNVTLYAVWTENAKNNITYDKNGGEGFVPIDPSFYYEGDLVTLPEGNNLSKTNYSFGGWSLVPDGSAINGQFYTMGGTNVTLYAVWIEHGKYTVTYDTNGGTGQVPTDSHQYYSGDTVTLAGSTGLSRLNHSFEGWALIPGGSIISESAYTMENKNVTFYAVWKAIPTPVIPNPGVITEPVETTQEVRRVNVNDVNDTAAKTVATVDVVRETSQNRVVDKVVLEQNKTEEILQKMNDQQKNTVQIVVKDIPDDRADEVEFVINQDSKQRLADSQVKLELQTEEVSILIPQETILAISDNEDDLYFRVVPVREEELQKAEIQNAITAEVVLTEAGNTKVAVLGTPMMIETNYKQLNTKITFSLKEFTLPSDPDMQKAYLDSLGVYIRHSDGEQELNHGTIIYDENEVPIGLEIEINKFSTFTIVSIANSAPAITNLKMKGTAVIGNKLTVSYTYRDAEEDEQGNSMITWYRADNASGQNKELMNQGNKKTYRISKEDQGYYIIVEVTPMAITGELKGKAVSASVKVKAVNKAPKATSVKLKGKTAVGNKLTVSYIYEDPEQDQEGSTGIRWYRANNINGNEKEIIKGANQPSYKLKAEDIGKYIGVEITPIAVSGSKKGAKVTVLSKKPVSILDSGTEIKYNTHVKLGVIGSETYAKKVVELFARNYKNVKTELKKEGKYYRIYLDFTSQAAAKKACTEMKEKKYIINYYFY